MFVTVMIKCDARVTPMMGQWCSLMFYVKDIYLVHAILVLMFLSVAKETNINTHFAKHPATFNVIIPLPLQ